LAFFWKPFLQAVAVGFVALPFAALGFVALPFVALAFVGCAFFGVVFPDFVTGLPVEAGAADGNQDFAAPVGQVLTEAISLFTMSADFFFTQPNW
jgi:hypothetical protein